MNDFIVPIVIAVLSSGALSALVTHFFTRRKLRAETGEVESRRDVNEAQEANTFAEAIQKFMDAQEKLQDRNRELYEQIVILEKDKAESDRSVEVLSERLNVRDAQIKGLSSQLQILQDKDRQGEISNALVAQQKALLQIADDYRQIIDDRERTIKELKVKTGQLLELPAREKKGTGD
jgi:hypothetical protein